MVVDRHVMVFLVVVAICARHLPMSTGRFAQPCPRSRRSPSSNTSSGGLRTARLAPDMLQVFTEPSASWERNPEVRRRVRIPKIPVPIAEGSDIFCQLALKTCFARLFELKNSAVSRVFFLARRMNALMTSSSLNMRYFLKDFSLGFEKKSGQRRMMGLKSPWQVMRLMMRT